MGSSDNVLVNDGLGDNNNQTVACDQCSLSLRSMKCLENHMKAKHNANDSSFYCSECGVSMATQKQLKNHQRCHKTEV